MKQNSQDKNTRLIAIILLAITVMNFNSVSAEDELINKDSLLKKRTEQYLLSNERNLKMNNLLGIEPKNSIINPDQEKSSFNFSNSFKQELINNSKLSLSPRKAQKLVGVYDISWKDSGLNDLILEISSVGKPYNGVFTFRYSFYFGDKVIIYDEIGLVIDDLMTFHVPVGDIVNIYYANLLIRQNSVTATGIVNEFYSQLICDDVERGKVD
jgi:hypothetical protein